MSRSYNMSVHVTAYQPKRAKAIRAAATAEWNFNWCHDANGNIYGDADGSLGGGESEQEQAGRDLVATVGHIKQQHAIALAGILGSQNFQVGHVFHPAACIARRKCEVLDTKVCRIAWIKFAMGFANQALVAADCAERLVAVGSFNGRDLDSRQERRACL